MYINIHTYRCHNDMKSHPCHSSLCRHDIHVVFAEHFTNLSLSHIHRRRDDVSVVIAQHLNHKPTLSLLPSHTWVFIYIYTSLMHL